MGHILLLCAVSIVIRIEHCVLKLYTQPVGHEQLCQLASGLEIPNVRLYLAHIVAYLLHLLGVRRASVVL